MNSLICLVLAGEFMRLALTASFQHGGSKNMQIFSYISKQVDCGRVLIDEEDILNSSLNNYNSEENNIDAPNERLKSDKDFIANLSLCLNEQGILYSSYSAHLNSKLAQNIFDEYFVLNETQGKYLVRFYSF